MIVKSLPVGQLEANCYMLADEDSNEALIIDPGDEPDKILEMAEGLDVKYIVLTHAHFDHAGAVHEIKDATGAAIVLHELDTEHYDAISTQGSMWGFKMEPLPPYDSTVSEGDIITIGSSKLTVIHTPGHTPGSMCLYCEDGFVITGDTLFAGSIGRTDFPGGSHKDIKASFRKLMGLPSNTAVFSGHGPASSIGVEKEQNMFAAEFLS